MASEQQSRIQSYLEKNRIGPLFEEMMTKLITETPDHPIPFLIGHLQTKQESPGRLQRTLSGSAALWADSGNPESKSNRRDFRSYDKAWQIHPKKPKKSKSDLAVSNISPPSPESKSLPRSIERPSWDWRSESREFDELNHILLESKKLGKALENLSRSIALSDELDQDPRVYNSVLRPRVVGEWVGRDEVDSDPLAAEMLQPPVPRAKTDGCWGSGENSPAGSLKMEVKNKGLKQQQQHHKKLLAAMLSQDSLDSMTSSAPSVTEDEMEDEDDAMELLEDLDDLRMEGVTGLVPSGSKFSQGRSSYCPEPQAKVTLNICSRCARLQGNSLTPGGGDEEPAPKKVPEQAVPEVTCPLPAVAESLTAAELELQSVSQVSAQRYPVWPSDLKPVRGTSPQAQRRALQLQELLFSKELENMGKHLAEVEKDLAKLAEQGKLSRSPNSPHNRPLLSSNLHTSSSSLPVPGLSSRPQSPSKTTGLPLLSTKPTSLTMSRSQSPSNPSSRAQTPGSRAQTPSGARTPSRPLTPNSLMMRSLPTTSHGNTERVYGRSRSRPVTPTGQKYTRPLLTPPGLSSTDSFSFSLRSTLSEDEFYQQLQAVRQPWLIPSDTDSDCLEPPEQDKCNPSAMRDANKRSVFSGL
ncbi:uncharacterized protein C8orf34 homolog isoform X1 [Astyanax mexicanus]|uniref:Chromosome 8 open reading frame 34 n=2 Tax=Astyanax mexicanus TaxID=7994 RepID=W5K3F1_ASTMX|nr:uncharacterized protein C8orf34 homolog isoform X1 [Astyanax mexicanus]